MQKGFTLLETVIAVSILSVGIAGSIGLVNQTVKLGFAVNKQLTGAYLAQEGMEVIHNIRHTNWIEDGVPPPVGPAAWDAGITDGDSCVNYNSTSLITPCAGAARKLFILDDGIKLNYVHTATPISTVFSRYINITHLMDGTEPYILVKSIVEWDTGSIQAEGRLYNWK
jgi:prepilin-type N-terminal cleavage/methylation domain-containing protein